LNKKFFGTDGIRGTVNESYLTADTALKLGIAAGKVFTRGPHIHRVVIGKDTRVSGYMLETALTSGFTSVGMDVFLFGPIPTPAVAFLTQALRADIGVMITASHNTYEDNGFKLKKQSIIGLRYSLKILGAINSLFLYKKMEGSKSSFLEDYISKIILRLTSKLDKIKYLNKRNLYDLKFNNFKSKV